MDQLRIISPADLQADILPGGTYTRATGFFSFFALLGAVTMAAVTLWGCSQPALQGAAASEQILGRALVDALNQSDPEALEALLLTESEYTDILYPALPVSKPDWNTPADVAWAMHAASRSKLQQRIAAEWSGHNLRFVSLVYRGQAEIYSGFEVLRQAALRVQLADGTEQDLTFVGSALRQNGNIKLIGWKDY